MSEDKLNMDLTRIPELNYNLTGITNLIKKYQISHKIQSNIPNEYLNFLPINPCASHLQDII